MDLTEEVLAAELARLQTRNLEVASLLAATATRSSNNSSQASSSGKGGSSAIAGSGDASGSSTSGDIDANESENGVSGSDAIGGSSGSGKGGDDLDAFMATNAAAEAALQHQALSREQNEASAVHACT